MIQKRFQQHNILGIGAPIIDSIVHVSEQFLSSIPGAKGGMVVVDYPTFESILKNTGSVPSHFLGGSAANVIRGLARLGEKCAFFGKIGNDLAGKLFEEGLEAIEIVPLLQKIDIPTSQVACLVTPDKERTMRAYLGASKELVPEDLHAELFEKVKVVHIEGYTILTENLTKQTMQFAQHAGNLISFDIGSFELASNYKDQILGLLSDLVNIVFANQDEVKHLTGLDPIEGGKKLAELCDIAVILMGAEGCVVFSRQEQIKVVPDAVKVVDTTGAGDFFASGFLYGILNNASLKKCAEYGTFVASAVVGQQGVNLPEDEWQRIRNLLD